MLKLLLILGITVYIIYKVGLFLFRIGAASQQFRDQSQGNINNNGTKKGKKPKITGEYIDYEEVK